jgi:hypothetical protein
MDTTAEANPIDQAFELAKKQAAIDGAFDDDILRHWFEAAWDTCAGMVGFNFPAREISEPIVVRRDGSFTLSYRPSSAVKIYEGATLVMTLPASLERSRCDPALCCFCWLTAHYWTGEDACAISPRFLQAVFRLFTYIAENRGDATLDEHVLKTCGAFAFLAPDVTYLL